MRRALPAAVATAIGFALSASPAFAQLELATVGGQAFPSPRYIAAPPGDESRVFVVQANGIVRTVDTVADTTAPAPFLDASAEVCDAAEGCGGEAGMFSIAFPPNYAASALFYVYFTRDVSPGTHEIVIREYRAADPDDADESSGRDVLVIPHPVNQNHNGGQLQFGPDGYLYAATGDGGGADDPRNNAQTLNRLLGKLLRIDPADPPGAASYSIPPDNPFAGAVPGADEIYSYGLRNPYRFSFERATGFVAIGDVGQAAQEEVDFVSVGDARGANFGWDCFEGTAIGLSALLLQPQCTPMSGAHTGPVLTYQRPLTGAAVNGGYVVMDPAVPSLLGRYLYADSIGALGNAIRSAVLFPGGHAENRATGLTAPNVVSFGEDACGRIYVAADPSGTVNDLVSRIEDSGGGSGGGEQRGGHRRAVQRRAERQQDTRRAGGQVHREPEQPVARERDPVLVRQRVPGQPAYLPCHLPIGGRRGPVAGRRPAGQVEQDAGPAGEQAGKDVHLRLRCPDHPSTGHCELRIGAAGQVLVQRQPDPDAAHVEVRHGPPALVDFQHPVVAHHAAMQVLPEGGRRPVQEPGVAGVVVGA